MIAEIFEITKMRNVGLGVFIVADELGFGSGRNQWEA
jgi:hypothetical protein